ncbi:MAG: alpha/beta hydrolase fold domain-containing protein [Pseudomonadota bacterium]
MSARLRLLNTALRTTQKPYLARLRSIPRARRALERSALLFFRRPRGFRSAQATIDGPAGPLRLLWASTGAALGAEAPAVVLFLHGGAYLQGSAWTHRHLGAALADRIGGTALLPDYRLAPEAPFPAALDDALASYRWALAAGVPAARLVLAGDSAGAGLALGLLHTVLAEGLAPPAAVVVFSPWADLTLSGGSIRANARRDVLIPAARLAAARNHYLAGTDPTDPRVSPIFGRFAGGPPILLQASLAEVLLDDSRAMAEALTRQGVEHSLSLWPDVPHVWQIFHGSLPEADAALDEAGAFLRRHLGPARSQSGSRSD